MGTQRLEPASARGGGTALPDATLHALAAARPDLAWNPSSDIATARNAHRTNHRSELADALKGEYDWLEGDIRLDPAGRPVMQHDFDAPVDLDLATWLEVGRDSGRGLKLDIKDRAALPATIDAAQRAGVDERRLIVNVGTWPAPELLAIRRAFPNAIVNIGTEMDADLSAADLVGMQVASRIVGGPVMFPVRLDLATPGVVRALRPYGRVAIWNPPGLINPRPDEAAHLRAMGVDGMIDLREPGDWRMRVSSSITGAAASLVGWRAVCTVLDALDLLTPGDAPRSSEPPER